MESKTALLIVTNHNGDKIKTISKFDVKFNMWRVDVKLKKPSQKTGRAK